MSKRIISWVCIALLIFIIIGMALSALFWPDLFMVFFLLMIIVPVLMFIFIKTYDVLKKKGASLASELESEEGSQTSDDN